MPGAGRRPRRGSHETHHKWAPGESRGAAAAGEGGPRPRGRRPRAATRGRLGAAWRAGERRAPCTSCSAHAAFHRPALAEPASGPRRPSLPAPCARDAARRTDAAGAPSGWPGPASRAAAGTRARSRAGAQLPGRSRLRLPLPPPLSGPAGGRAGLQTPGWFILRPRIIFTCKLSRCRQTVRLGAGTEGRFPDYCPSVHLPCGLPLGIRARS